MSKKTFVIRDTPAWLDQHQDWISDGARHLYKVLRSLADQKSGRLFIPGSGPGRGWITLRTVELRSGYCEETRLKYMRELKKLEAVDVFQPLVTRLVRGRFRTVKGKAQVTILSLRRPNPHKQGLSASTAPGTEADRPHKQTVSYDTSGCGKTGKVGLPHPESSGPEDSGRQVLSEPTSTVPPAEGSPLGLDKENVEKNHHQKAPAPNPDDDSFGDIPSLERNQKRQETFDQLMKESHGVPAGIVNDALDVIDGRALASGTQINSPNYYMASLIKELSKPEYVRRIRDSGLRSVPALRICDHLRCVAASIEIASTRFPKIHEGLATVTKNLHALVPRVSDLSFEAVQEEITAINGSLIGILSADIGERRLNEVRSIEGPQDTAIRKTLGENRLSQMREHRLQCWLLNEFEILQLAAWD